MGAGDDDTKCTAADDANDVTSLDYANTKYDIVLTSSAGSSTEHSLSTKLNGKKRDTLDEGAKLNKSWATDVDFAVDTLFEITVKGTDCPVTAIATDGDNKPFYELMTRYRCAKYPEGKDCDDLE